MCYMQQWYASKIIRETAVPWDQNWHGVLSAGTTGLKLKNVVSSNRENGFGNWIFFPHLNIDLDIENLISGIAKSAQTGESYQNSSAVSTPPTANPGLFAVHRPVTKKHMVAPYQKARWLAECGVWLTGQAQSGSVYCEEEEAGLVWLHHPPWHPIQDHSASTFEGGRRRGSQRKSWLSDYLTWEKFQIITIKERPLK